jgi:ubiquinol-cytochrome c reductase cytochrome b subunit
VTADAPPRVTPPPLAPLSVRTASRVSKYFSDRLDSSPFLRRSLNKVFPDNWTFLFGEIALYSFIILVLTGTYLGLFFRPGETPVIYNGSYVPLRGVEMSRAFDSMIRISFDVRGGLLMRQIHHWAADVFVAAIVLHLCRIFFTAAFRRPREINWLVGVGLLMLALLEGFAGYSLPDDLLSGTGLRIAYSIVESIPVIGTWLCYLVWGGEFPGDGFNDRLFFAHTLLIPGVIIALITAHLGIIWHQKHTDFGGAGKTESRVVGSRFFPEYAAKSTGLFLMIFGALALLGGLAQINPIWLYGPYDPSQVSNASQPDWYVLFLEGSLRLMPSIEWHFAGLSLPFEVFGAAVLLPAVLFGLLALYPFLEQRFTRDKYYHDELDRPRDHPVRTGLGAGALFFYLVLAFAGSDDVISHTFSIPENTLVWVFRFLVILGPPVVYKLTASFCRGLMQDDDEEQIEGIESGIIVRHASGEYVEITTPPPPPEPPRQEPNDPEAAIAESAESDGQQKGRARKLAGAVVGFFVEDNKTTTK